MLDKVCAPPLPPVAEVPSQDLFQLADIGREGLPQLRAKLGSEGRRLDVNPIQTQQALVQALDGGGPDTAPDLRSRGRPEQSLRWLVE